MASQKEDLLQTHESVKLAHETQFTKTKASFTSCLNDTAPDDPEGKRRMAEFEKLELQNKLDARDLEIGELEETVRTTKEE